MVSSSKETISLWIIIFFIALMLWFRNYKYDKIFAVFLISISFIFLILYGIYNGANMEQSSKAIFLLLGLQCIIITLGVSLFIYNNKIKDVSIPIYQLISYNISLFLTFLSFILFIFFVLATFFSGNIFETKINDKGNIEFYKNGMPSFGFFEWIYYFIIISSIFILLFFYNFKEISLILIFSFVIIIFIFILTNFSPSKRIIIWSYSSLVIAFLLLLTNTNFNI